MGLWSKMKLALGLGRVLIPKIDEVATKAEEAKKQADQAKEIAEQAKDVIREVKDLWGGVPVAAVPHVHPDEAPPAVLATSWTPSSTPGVGGKFLLFRGGHPVFEFDGDWHTCRIKPGSKLPPGGQRGDVWRQIDERR